MGLCMTVVVASYVLHFFPLYSQFVSLLLVAPRVQQLHGESAFWRFQLSPRAASKLQTWSVRLQERDALPYERRDCSY